MDIFSSGEIEIAYRVFGNGDKTVVIDTALSSCSAEWWHIAEKMSEHFKVLTFDRAGYGKSKSSQKERTPQNVANELDSLLISQGISENIILLGHSQGGLYSVQYALNHPSKVIGMILLDPATPFDDEFVKSLSKREYKRSGVDKTLGLKLGLWFTTLKLAFLIKPLLKKAPPFYYYPFADDAKKYLLKSLCRKSTYKTALREYKYSHMDNTVSDVKKATENKALGNIPITLITHSSEVYHKELQEFGGMDIFTAKKIESIWQGIMLRYMNLSNDVRHTVAEKSGHFIHLTDLDVVLKSVYSHFSN